MQDKKKTKNEANGNVRDGETQGAGVKMRRKTEGW